MYFPYDQNTGLQLYTPHTRTQIAKIYLPSEWTLNDTVSDERMDGLTGQTVATARINIIYNLEVKCHQADYNLASVYWAIASRPIGWINVQKQ